MSAHRTRRELGEVAEGSSAVEKRLRLQVLHCSYCKPHRGENKKGRVPRGDRHKNKR